MLKEFHYKIDWRTKSHLPGHHRSTQPGGGLEFRGNVPLLDAPDPRRLDIRASLTNPFDQWFVRSFRQRSQVSVYLIADLSASMGFRGIRKKLDVMAEFTESLAYSVHRTGDRFAFIGCDETMRDDFLLPPTHLLGAGLDIAQRLRRFEPTGKSANGLQQIQAYLPLQKGLIFLVSDFHFDAASLTETLQMLARHRICPIVLWDQAEYQHLPKFGLASVHDSETGRRRTVLLRRSLHQRIQAEFEARRIALIDLFMKHGTRPLFVRDAYDADQLTQYFFQDDLNPNEAGV